MKKLRATWMTATIILLTFAISDVDKSCRAADPPAAAIARPALEPKVAELIDFVAKGRIDTMLDRIGPIPDRERQAFDETRQHLLNIYSNAGKFGGYDIAGYKVLTPRFQVVYVLVYFDKRPILFEFGFYNVNDIWRPQTFTLETNFKALLDTLPMQR